MKSPSRKTPSRLITRLALVALGAFVGVAMAASAEVAPAALAKEAPDLSAIVPLSTPEEEATLRAEMQHMGFDPDDAIDRRAFLAEIQSQPAAASHPPLANAGNTITAAGDFAPDPNWGYPGGPRGVYPERYGDAYGDHAYRGIKGAVLPDGDVVVAGLIQAANGHKQLGITRRGPTGALKPWTNIDPRHDLYGNKQYYVWPRDNAYLPSIDNVRDIKIHNNNIYVLVTAKHIVDGQDKYRPNVVVLRSDGSSINSWHAYHNDSNSQYAIAMDILDNELIVVTNFRSNSGGFWTVRYTINADGGLEDLRIADYPTVAGSDQIRANDIVFRRRPLNIYFGKPDAYILYTRTYDGTLDKNAHILAVKADGSIDTSFDGDGIYGVDFNDPDSAKEDIGIAITANAWGSPFNGGGEGIFVLARVARKTKWGIGIYALTNRQAHPVFGNNGTGSIVFGGCGVASPGGPPVGEGCRRFFDPSLVSHVPSDIEIIGDHLVVSGQAKVTGDTLYGQNGDYPMLARVHGHTGAVDQLSRFNTRNTGRNDGQLKLNFQVQHPIPHLECCHVHFTNLPAPQCARARRHHAQPSSRGQYAGHCPHTGALAIDHQPRTAPHDPWPL